MRQKEGRKIKVDLENRIEVIKQKIEKVLKLVSKKSTPSNFEKVLLNY